MRLLNAHTQEIKDFISHIQAPPYAILSHTWGDEEVSLNDWENKPREYIKRKEGYEKIQKCCKQAAVDGLDWVWVDTCCIDKSSSAELSEAINSMFRWYKNADVCYAYLCDVSDGIESDIGSSLAKCRWVTRGWTLQELIAPRQVVFYSSKWKILGTRSTLSTHLATATGIDKPYLFGRNLDEASIAQRMSWAAKRQTSREEDEAYCLLGIFNVNMPLIYGEGTKAFRRLQEILVREYPEDHSLFAWGKIVKRLSNQVDDSEQIWESKPISDDHSKVVPKYFGLLADSTEDFQHSSQVMCAPEARRYFRYGPVVPSVSSLIGHTAHVDLPIDDGIITYTSTYLKRLQTIQINNIRYFVLLCGCWNDSHTDFHLITVPVICHFSEYSRLEEIVLSDIYTRETVTVGDLRYLIKRCSITPMLPFYPPNGSIVVRRHVTSFEWYIISDSRVDLSLNSGLVISPSSQYGRLFCATYDRDGLGLTITAIRLGALNHSYDEDLTQARDCGKLSFRIHPFAISGHANPELNIKDNGGLSHAPALLEKLNLMSFSTVSDANDYSFREWHEIKYKHDMIQPRDEWRFSAVGVADVFISVERFFFDECDSYENLSNDELHPFVDVLDIVVKANEEDNIVEENRDQHQQPNDATHEKKVTGKIIDEEAITRLRRRTKRGLERMRMHIRNNYRLRAWTTGTWKADSSSSIGATTTQHRGFVVASASEEDIAAIGKAEAIPEVDSSNEEDEEEDDEEEEENEGDREDDAKRRDLQMA